MCVARVGEAHGSVAGVQCRAERVRGSESLAVVACWRRMEAAAAAAVHQSDNCSCGFSVPPARVP
ncbi:hypothetical protein E2C01_025251 [Portunus trituberculatus]|uniref:Uncharacterized protein n=1 Tax=Portunus trituberculatus TaxID=210409 RepID=A0A5B7ECR4_PORTR|nr:hypothetical protein [Portunus trituberculatus]